MAPRTVDAGFSSAAWRHRAEALNAFRNRAVDVFLAEGLAGRAKHHDFVGSGQHRSFIALACWASSTE